MLFTVLFWRERWGCALHWLSLAFIKLKCYRPLDTSQRAEVVLNNVVPYSCLSIQCIPLISTTFQDAGRLFEGSTYE